jgi:hypothetical protein
MMFSAVVAADVLIDADEDLTVGEAVARHFGERDSQLPANLFRQRTVPRARQQLEPMSRYGKPVHAEPCKIKWDKSLVNSDRATAAFPRVDSNHDSNIQSVVSCHWTTGEVLAI